MRSVDPQTDDLPALWYYDEETMAWWINDNGRDRDHDRDHDHEHGHDHEHDH